MASFRIALVGAGSRSFGPATVRDVLLSKPLAEAGAELVLMDIDERAVREVEDYARWAADRLGSPIPIRSTTRLEEALDGARAVVDAIEISRDVYWAMDFHVPRNYGFRQIYGENGGPGSLFHALRNMGPIVEIARAMERLCPDALLLNYTNPMHKLCEAATRLTGARVVGLCHGIAMGIGQLSAMLGVPAEDLEVEAAGINHCTWFTRIRRKSTGEDLYPALREADRQGDPLYDWHEVGLSRILLRRFGLYPSPGANHIGEYIGWADEFFASNLHWYYDPCDGHPWETGRAPEFVYTVGAVSTHRPLRRESAAEDRSIPRGEIRPSGENAQPILEALATGQAREIDAVNVPNRGYVPNLPDGTVVEVPALADARGVHPKATGELPEPVAAILRTQASIQRLLVEAFAERSKDKLLQAVLLEPTVDSYRRAVAMVDEMLRLQKELLPPLE
ncbi:MAG: alpha-galactosidase [Fimbriimonadaceae bacterium]